MRVLIEDVSFSQMGDLINMVFLHDEPEVDVLDDSWMLGTD